MLVEIEEICHEYGFTLRIGGDQFQFGYAHVSFLEDRKAKLSDIYIEEEFEYSPWPLFRFYRKQGHGTCLLKKVIAKCKSKGVVEISWDIHGDDTVLISWYEKHGFEIINGRRILCRLKQNLLSNVCSGQN